MAKFTISIQSNGAFQFNLRAANGQVMLTGEEHDLKADCLDSIEKVKQYAADDNRYERKTTVNGKFFFNLKAANGEVIGTSQLYNNEWTRDKGIVSVKSNAPEASLESGKT